MVRGVVAPRTGERCTSTEPSRSTDLRTSSASPVWKRVERASTAHNLRRNGSKDHETLYAAADVPIRLATEVHGVMVPRIGVPSAAEVGRGAYWHELIVSGGTVELVKRKRDDVLPSLGPVPHCEDCGGLHWPDRPCKVVDELFPADVRTDEWTGELRSNRGEISEWSGRSRNRMLKRLATLDYDVAGIWEMLTLTYPADFPLSGRVCKAHLRAFRARYERRWGPIQACWKFEFQRRGAPHFHLYVARPTSSTWREWMRWCERAWFEVVGSGDPKHLRAGVGVDRQFCSRTAGPRAIAWYFAKHQSHAGAKGYQNEVPEGFRDCGRFWGYWNLENTEQTAEVGEDFAVEAARVLRSYRRSQTRGGKKLKLRGSTPSVWVLAWHPTEVLRRLVDWHYGQGEGWVNARPKSYRFGEVMDWEPGRTRPLP